MDKAMDNCFSLTVPIRLSTYQFLLAGSLSAIFTYFQKLIYRDVL